MRVSKSAVTCTSESHSESNAHNNQKHMIKIRTLQLTKLQAMVKDERRRNIWCTNMELEKTKFWDSRIFHHASAATSSPLIFPLFSLFS